MRRVDRLTVDLERRRAVEYEIQLLLTRPGLVVLIDQRAVIAGRQRVDSERVDPEVLAHRNISAAPLDLVEVRHLPVLLLVVHPITSELRGSLGIVDQTTSNGSPVYLATEGLSEVVSDTTRGSNRIVSRWPQPGNTSH